MLTDLITLDRLMDLAGRKVFWRGESYYSNAAVRRLHQVGERLTAQVRGTEVYEVALSDDDDGTLGYECTCPHAADGYFCKHCVAVGLAWLAGDADRLDSDASEERTRDPWQTIQEYLGTQPPAILIDLLLDTARRDDRLYRALLLRAERSGAGTDLARTFRRAIEEATPTGKWLDPSELAGDLDELAASLEELLQPDTAALLVDLTEYAIERGERALRTTEDSEGETVEVLERLCALHRDACVMSRPDPAELATRLFRFEAECSFDICRFSPADYQEALGPAGLRHYRELAEAQWHALGPRGSGDRDDPRRARLTRIMENLARASGDIQELIAIRAQDLSSAYHYLDIAELWVKAGQPDQALDWAERGLRAFPERTNDRLRDFLVAVYLDRGRLDEALQLTWIQYEERSDLAHYQKLHRVAERLGVWPAQRERALVWLEEHITHEAAATSRWKPQPSVPNYSPRLDIALWEQDLEAAWTATQQGTCDRRLLIALAGQLEATRPEDAIALYRRIVPTVVQETKNSAYEEAIRLIRRIGVLMRQQDQAQPFSSYLAELRVRYKAKRNFIVLLDRVGRG